MERIVIAGAGLAGHRAAVAVRKDGFDGELIVLSDEPHRPYDRPPLSKQVLAGTMEESDVHYDEHHDLELEWRGEAEAAGLDAAAHEVVLADGDRVPYDGLIVATGRRARTIPALEHRPGVHVLRSLDDAVAFKAAVAGSPRVVIVGGGFIGCEVAATLRKLGVESVALVDAADQPMTPLGPEVGRRAVTLHERNGVVLHLGSGVAALHGDDAVSGVELDDGTHLPADVVLLALGSAPNTEWLEDSGVELVRGAVRCEDTLHAVGVDDVVCAGDVAAVPHPLADGELVCIEHWAIARDMGAAAARNLLAPVADRSPFATVPTFWSDQYDVKMKSAGLLSVAEDWVVIEEDTDRPSLVVEGRRGDTLVGAVVWNRNKSVLGYQKELAARLASQAPA